MSAIRKEVEGLRLDDAEAFFAVTIHRTAHGEPSPTVTIVTPGDFTPEHSQEMRQHLNAIVATLRKASAPKDGAK